MNAKAHQHDAQLIMLVRTRGNLERLAYPYCVWRFQGIPLLQDSISGQSLLFLPAIGLYISFTELHETCF
jgi:hypothetical protein